MIASPSTTRSAAAAAMRSSLVDARALTIQDVDHGGALGAAVRTGQQALALEIAEVAPDGDLGDAEVAGQRGHRQRPVLRQQVEDVRLAARTAHGHVPHRLRLVSDKLSFADI